MLSEQLEFLSHCVLGLDNLHVVIDNSILGFTKASATCIWQSLMPAESLRRLQLVFFGGPSQISPVLPWTRPLLDRSRLPPDGSNGHNMCHAIAAFGMEAT